MLGIALLDLHSIEVPSSTKLFVTARSAGPLSSNTAVRQLSLFDVTLLLEQCSEKNLDPATSILEFLL